MRFRIAGWVYSVRITDEPIYDDDGRLLNGRADADSREILISAAVPAHLREEVLAHEIRHAWAFHTDGETPDEKESNLFASITRQYIDDLATQGGLSALKRMRAASSPPPNADPEPVFVPEEEGGDGTSPAYYVHPNDTVARPSGLRAQCGKCARTIAAGCVATAPAKWQAAHGGAVCRRQLYCPHCHHVQSWMEGCDLQGHPNGSVIGEPEYAGGAAVDAFLREHPEAEGMLTI